MTGQLTIYCIGDSHVSFFSGRDDMQPIWPELSRDRVPLFKTYRLGPVTAYNLIHAGGTNHGREKLFEVLKSIQPGSTVLLCFGEIDCRVHLLKQAESQKRPLAEIVKECVNRYWTVITEVKKHGFNVLVWGVIASTNDEKSEDPEFAAYGASADRNRVSQMFNDMLAERSSLEDVKLVSIFESLVNKGGLTNFTYYVDPIHLSQKALPLVIMRLKEISTITSRQLFKSELLGILPFIIGLPIFAVICRLRAAAYQFKLFKNMLKEKIVKLINSSKFLANKKIILDWHRAGRPLPPPSDVKREILKKYARWFSLKIFVETGTFTGDTVEAMKKTFKRLYSVELAPGLAKKAEARFAGNSKVTIIEGDSGEVMPELLKNISEPALFWLDGHYSSGITAKGSLDTPIYKELNAVLNHQIKNHVILIDDARLFVGANDYPTMAELEKFVRKFRPNASISVKTDIIRII